MSVHLSGVVVNSLCPSSSGLVRDVDDSGELVDRGVDNAGSTPAWGSTKEDLSGVVVGRCRRAYEWTMNSI